MSDWLFDLGNSRFKFAPLAGEAIGSVQAWPHGAEAMTAAAVMVLQFGDQPDATTGMFGFVTIAAFAGFGAFGCGYRFRHGEWP